MGQPALYRFATLGAQQGLPELSNALIVARRRGNQLVVTKHLMAAFQIGDDRRHFDEVDGLVISLDWYRQQPDEVAELLDKAGFDVRVKAVREPEIGVEKTPHGYRLARKPQSAEIY